MRLVAPLALLVVAFAAPVAAGEWNGIKAGETTMTQVRARHGAPTRETPQKVEGYDTMQWVYDGPRAPVGTVRVTVDFGLKTAAGYHRDVVRTFTLDLKHETFNRRLILDGWGTPDRVGKQGEIEFFLYREGVLVYFDTAGERAVSMIFTPPQPLEAPPPQR